MTGLCSCSAGFMGPTCHQMCNAGFYGLNCSSVCQCFATGTRSCHNVNGSCDCLDDWTGEICDVEFEGKYCKHFIVPALHAFQLSQVD